MAVKRTQIDTALEKQILIGMIVSTEYLRDVTPIYMPDLLEIKFAPIVANWCMTYYNTYKKAPGLLIQELFESWERNNTNSEQIKYIDDFLATLSDEHEHADKFNAPYIMDKTLVYFKKRSYQLLSDDLRYHTQNDNIEDAEQTLNEFKKVERLVSKGIDPFNDMSAIQSSFDNNYEPLFIVPGKLGELMNDQLTRDSFIALLAPEKRGKSWWLQQLGMWAHRGRCNVVEFQVGDMSEPQRVRRQHISLARKSDKLKYCQSLLIPVLDCENNQKNLCDSRNRASNKWGVYEDGEKLPFEDAPDHNPCTYCSNIKGSNFKGATWQYKRAPVEPLEWREAYKVSQEYLKRVRPKGYKLFTYPSRSINVTQIKAQLDLLERTEGFVPDVILIDYADILAPEPNSSNEERHRKNETWLALRGLSQLRHCCVITASQADAASYYQTSITKSNFSEDKRIFGHVTAMFALNQTIEEKLAGIMRIAPLVIREDAYDESYNVHVGGSLAIGCPYLFSY